MRLSIVVEGREDEELINAVVSSVLVPGSFRIVCARGKSHAISMAGTMLTVEEEPVVLAIDADTSNPGLLAEQRSDLSALLNRAAHPGHWRVVFFVPEIESVLVYDDAVVRRLFGRSLDEVERALRDVAPKKSLARLTESTGTSWHQIVKQIAKDTEIASLLAKAPGMSEIVQFAEQVVPNAAE